MITITGKSNQIIFAYNNAENYKVLRYLLYKTLNFTKVIEMNSNASCSISGRSFQGRCLQNLQRTYEQHKTKPLPPVFKTRIDGPSPLWKVFKRLQLAIEFADTATKDCMIFSYEGKVDSSGQRLFLVAHPKHMWSNYKIRPPKEKCSYEVIRENFPCKLYFDLEFYKVFNPGKDGVLMTKIFIKSVMAFILEQHNIVIQETDFLWLDASNSQKYSCHLILQMKHSAFQNNIQAGIFVYKLLSSLKEKINNSSASKGLWPSVDEIKNLVITSKNNNQIFFCDEAVYSKNRNFRLYLSTKAGKDSPLKLSPYNQYVPSATEKDKDEAIFYDSLITYFRGKAVTKLLSYTNDCSSNNFRSSSSSALSRTPNTRLGVSSYISSPFPNLDEFILGIIKNGSEVGFIRKWTYYSDENKIVYDIGNYRFCYNIGRHHKSNNIRLVVDMKARFYYQTCLDPECRKQFFQSEAFEIPEYISFVNIPEDFFDDGCFSQFENKKNIGESIDPEHSENIFSSETYSKACIGVDASENINWELDDISFFNNEVDEIPWIEMPNNDFFKTTAQLSDVGNSWKNFASIDLSCKFSEEIRNQKIENGADLNDAENSWKTLCCADLSSNFSEEANHLKMKNELDENDSCILRDEFWNIESPSNDSLGTITHEEELLMADAAEVTEATINGNMFCEETIF